MTITYKWVDAAQTQLLKTSGPNSFTAFFAEDSVPEYQEFLASGATAAAYVAPPEPAPQTTEEKVNHLLSDYGLTRDELLKAVDASSQ